MRKDVKLPNIIVAIICGFAAGAVVTYEFLNPAYWAVGALVGAMIAWVAYAPVGFARGAWQAALYTWREATKKRPKRERLVLTKLERDFIFWEKMSISVPLFTTVFYMLGLCGLSAYMGLGTEAMKGSAGAFVGPSVLLFLVIFVILSVFFGIPHQRWRLDLYQESRDYEADLRAIIERDQKITLLGNPLVGPFYVAYKALAVVAIFISLLGLFFLKIWDFTVSDGRITSALGAATGLTVAHFADENLVFGLLVGLASGIGVWTLDRFAVAPIRARFGR
jgi:hypothetical protein